MNITLIQNNGVENTSSLIIDKLYDISSSNNVTNFIGNLIVNKAYSRKVSYLNNKYNNFNINQTGDGYIEFQDSNVLEVLKNQIGDGIGVIESELSASNPNFLNNTSIVSFPESYMFSPNRGHYEGCLNLETLAFGSGTYLASYADTYKDCNNLHKFIVHDMKSWYESISRRYKQVLSVPQNANTLTKEFYNPDGSRMMNVVLPEGTTEFQGHHAGYDRQQAFERADINSVKIPSTLTILDGFTYSTIQTIDFTDSESLIKIGGFKNCINLNLNVSNIPQTVTTIKESAFEGCTNVNGILNLPNLTNIGNYAFDSTKLTKVNLPSVTELNLRSFGNISTLTEVNLDNQPINANGAFINCYNLTKLNGLNTFDSTGSVGKLFQENGITGRYCFYMTDLNADSEFVRSSIDEIVFPLLTSIRVTNNNDPQCLTVLPNLKKITFIKLQTFKGGRDWGNEMRRFFTSCPQLKVVDFGNELTEYSAYRAFEGCENLSAFIFRTTTPPSNSRTSFAALCNGRTPYIFVPDSAVNTYKNDDGWSFATDYIRPISEYVESDYITWSTDVVVGTYIKDLEVARILQEFNNGLPIKNQGDLTLLSNNLQDLSYKFAGNKNIKKFNEFQYLTNITETGRSNFNGTYQGQFENCTNLEEITLPSSLTNIGYQAFRGCTNLRTLNQTSFPNITSLSRAIFYNCVNLEGELNFPNFAGSIDYSNYFGMCFHFCKKLTKITLGHITSVGYIGSMYGDYSRYSFRELTSLKIIDFGDSITQYGESVFYQCSNIKAVIFRNTTPPTVTGNSQNDLWGNSTCNIYVPNSVYSTYQTTAPFDTLYSQNRLKTIENDYNETDILNNV